MTNTPLPDCRYTRTSDIIEADVGGEVVLLHTQNWQYYEFDPVGAAIWNLLESPANLDSLVESLTTRFEVSREQCLQETKAFLDEMVSQGLVTASNG
jgi:Coenzyme PQQ synthesis protein D (PqqD)